MATRTLTFTAEEVRWLSIVVGHEWNKADTKRMLSRPDSPQEKTAEADQLFIQQIQDKLRDSVTRGMDT